MSHLIGVQSIKQVIDDRILPSVLFGTINAINASKNAVDITTTGLGVLRNIPVINSVYLTAASVGLQCVIAADKNAFVVIGVIQGPSFDTKIGASIFRSTNQSIANATVDVISFDTVNFDTDGFADLTNYPTRLTCQVSGVYFVAAQLYWAANATGVRDTRLHLNGAINGIKINRTPTTASGTTLLTIAYPIALSKGDYVELGVYQTSGGALNAQTLAGVAPDFSMYRISGL